MSSEMMIIEEKDVSTAWAKAFLRITDPGVKELSPLVVTVPISDTPTPERQEIRSAVDRTLSAFKNSTRDGFGKLQEIHTVANTIFPTSLWNKHVENDADQLFDRFNKAWPRLKRCKQNRRGSYFRRLTSYRGNDGNQTTINQLKHIIDTYRGGNHRRSALQASLFDPVLDHNNARRQLFPCLHQVSFAPIGDDGLAVTGFYATQYIFDRAYGNYLGLCRLGNFMAHQMGLRLTRMTCVASVAQTGTPNKNELAELRNTLRPQVTCGEVSPE